MMKVNLLKCILTIITGGLLSTSLQGQSDTLRISDKECETLFLNQNLSLIAEKLHIEEARAEVLQAKLWPNPNLTIDQVNLWAAQYQLEGFDGLPPFAGNFGTNQQFGIALEQMIITAGKRKKLMAVEQVQVDMAEQYFQELLRNLKVEFRNNLINLGFLQAYLNVNKEQLKSLDQLIAAYKKQIDQGNIGRGEYLRLKALQLEILQEVTALIKDINYLQSELKILMRIPASTVLIVNTSNVISPDKFKLLNPMNLLQTAKENRPDFKASSLQQEYYNRLYTYEKSQRTPDVNFLAAYDRGGSFMLDFVGFGLSMDLPVFNRNQGNIQKAQIGIDRSQTELQQKNLEVEIQVMLAYQNLITTATFYQSIENDFEQDLDKLLERYDHNFRERNLSLLEYLDFLDAYLKNKQTILEAVRDMQLKLEELQYQTGVDINEF